jgi:hypothetical protein
MFFIILFFLTVFDGIVDTFGDFNVTLLPKELSSPIESVRILKLNESLEMGSSVGSRFSPKDDVLGFAWYEGCDAVNVRLSPVVEGEYPVSRPTLGLRGHF